MALWPRPPKPAPKRVVGDPPLFRFITRPEAPIENDEVGNSDSSSSEGDQSEQLPKPSLQSPPSKLDDDWHSAYAECSLVGGVWQQMVENHGD